MRTAFYVRVSTERQQQAQTIEQQVVLLRAYVADRPDWVIEEQHIFRDDGHTGAKLQRPGLDALRDQAARANFDVVLVTAPDRLARNYVHQMVILEELERHGISVVFIDRPPSDDPHEQLVVQIRGAVAEYERTLIADRMRRGRQAKLKAGRLLPWTNAPYGYRIHPERPRDPALVEVDEAAARSGGVHAGGEPREVVVVEPAEKRLALVVDALERRHQEVPGHRGEAEDSDEAGEKLHSVELIPQRGHRALALANLAGD